MKKLDENNKDNITQEEISNNIAEKKNDIPEKKNGKLKRNILIGIISFVSIILIGGFIWANTSYKPQDTAKASIVSDENISVSVEENITFTPKNVKPTEGFIFYPGAKVDPMAYAPLCREIAEQGYEVVIVKMPLNFAIFSPNKAQEIIDKYDNIKTWVIGGHSLGGVMASKFASENNSIKGVVLLASYPQGEELKNLDKEVLSIWGDKDGVLNFENLEESKGNLPQDAEFIELKGGNHGQFGDYGMQKGDNEPSISAQEQTDKSANEIIDLLKRLELN